MAETALITADDLASLGAIDHASASSQAFIDFYADIVDGNISIAQQSGPLNSTASFVSAYIDQVEEGHFTPEEALAVFVADDFAAVKLIATGDEATQQALIGTVVYLNSHFHGLSATLAEASPDAKALFEARGFDFTQFQTLNESEPENTEPGGVTIKGVFLSGEEMAQRGPRLSEVFISRIEENGGAEFLNIDFNQVFDSDTPVDIRGAVNIYNALIHNNYEAIKSAIGNDDENIQNHMLLGLEAINRHVPGFIDDLRGNSNDIDDFFRLKYNEAPDVVPEAPTPNPHPDIATQPEEPVIEEPAVEADAYPIDIAPVDGAPTEDGAVPAEEVTEEEAELPPPPPRGASVLEGLIRPQITPRAVISLQDTKVSIGEISERLKNLPEDPSERQRALLDISDDLKELAIGLRPSVAGDNRLHTTPPTPSNPDNYEEQFGRLQGYVVGALVQDDVAIMVERLVQSSEAARTSAGALEYALRPEIEAERTLSEPVEPELDGAVEIEPELLEDGGADRIVEPSENAPDVTSDETDPAVDGAGAPQLDRDGDGVPDWIANATDGIIDGAAVDPVSEADAEIEEGTEAAPSPADILRENSQSMTVTRLSEVLDGKGYHNDSDGFTDFDALQGAFTRAAELQITSESVDAIRDVLSSPDFILKTSAAIEALSAYNAELAGSGNERDGLIAFFDTLSPEDFVRDRAGVRDDNSTFDAAERAAVRDETLRIERDIMPKL